MTPFRAIAVVLVVVLLVMAAAPARAEAMEPTTILLIAGAAVVVVILVAYLIVANMSDRRQAGAVPTEGAVDGLPIGGTRAEGLAGTPVDGAAISGTPVAVTSYVLAPAAPEPVASP
jgi:hypothetical protein